RYQQHFRFLRYLLSHRFTAISEICYRHSSIGHQAQTSSSLSIIDVAWGQQSPYYLPFDIYDHLQLEAKKPPLAGLAEICPILPEQSHPPVADWLADRDRLGVENKQVHLKTVTISGRIREVADDFAQRLQAGDPLLVRTKFREGGPIVEGDQQI